MNIKCRKCRCVLLEASYLVDNHNENLSTCQDSEMINKVCEDKVKEQVWFINYENPPVFVTAALDKGDWLTGKLNCFKCNARIGAFNFVQPRRCPCGQSNLPPIWLTKSKVDVNLIKHSFPTSEASTLLKTLPIISLPSPTEKYNFDSDIDLINSGNVIFKSKVGDDI